MSIGDVLRQIVETHKGVFALGTAFILGMTIGVGVLGFASRVTALEGSAHTADERLTRVEKVLEDLAFNVCVLTKLQNNDNILECRQVP